MPLRDIAYAVAICIIVAWTIYKELKQNKLEREYNLDDNPKRCREHGEAIARLEEWAKGTDKRLDEICKRLDRDQG